MKKIIFITLLMIGVFAPMINAAKPNRQQKVGLVLSGGGAKGIAEIGAIQAFEENDIPIDYITGTSMGAIVGGLYAAGYSPQEMMRLLASDMFMNASTGTISPQKFYMFFEPEKRPSIITLPFSFDKNRKNSILPTSLISPMPMNFAFMTIFSRQTAQCGSDFDKLFVPLRTVAADMTHQRKYVFRSGQLDSAIRASMSFPIVFKPIQVDGAMLYDGGIYDNFPFEVMKDEFNPDFMIGVDIHGTDTIKGFPDVLQQMDMLVMRGSDYDLPEDYGIKIRIDLNKFGLLDFQQAEQIYEIGYQHALTMVDSIKSRVVARRSAEDVANRRDAFRKATPKVLFESVDVKGGTPSENDYIKYIFTSERPDTFGLAWAEKSYMKVLSTGMLNDLEPQAKYNPATGRFALELTADIKDDFYFGLGGYFSSSVNSMLFLNLGYRSFSFKTVDLSARAWIGQSYMAGEFNARAMLRQRQNTSVGFNAVVWRHRFHESDKLFYEDEAPAFITNLETFYRLKFDLATGQRSTFVAGLTYGYKDDRFYDNDATLIGNSSTRNMTIQNLGQLMVKWERNTLDDALLPTSGSRFAVMGQGVIGNYKFTPSVTLSDEVREPINENRKWLQLELNYRKYFELNKKWSLGLETTLLASTKRLLSDYNAAVVDAYCFHPTPSSYNIFNPELRANSFVTLGAVPVFKLNDRIQFRGAFHGFMPFKHILKMPDDSAINSRWFDNPRFFGELSGVLKLPFGNLTLYGTYQTAPGNKWGVGVSFGYYILAPKMLRL